MKLIIIRGLPGSGKSTLAKRLTAQSSAIHLEADMYFITKDGTYEFDMTKLHLAHKWCIQTAIIMMNNGRDVIVSNTFTKYSEMRPYIDHAREVGAYVSVLRMSNQYGSIHDVPDEVMTKMAERFEDYDGEGMSNEL